MRKIISIALLFPTKEALIVSILLGLMSPNIRAQEVDNLIPVDTQSTVDISTSIENEIPSINITLPEVYSRWNPSSLEQEEDCLAKNIYFESWQEPKDGQIAVGLVTLNRLIEGQWKNSICDIVYQKGKTRIRGRIKTVAQFSWTTKSYSKHQPKNKHAYEQCLEIAKMLLANGSVYNIPDITQGSTYYHAIYVHRLDSGWKELDKVMRIGLHIFFREKQTFIVTNE